MSILSLKKHQHNGSLHTKKSIRSPRSAIERTLKHRNLNIFLGRVCQDENFHKQPLVDGNEKYAVAR